MNSFQYTTPDSAFPLQGMPDADVAREIEALCSADHRYSDGSVFNSICSEPLPFASAIYAKYADSNMGDNRVFPGPHQAERLVLGMLGSLLGLSSVQGVLTSGGTEANLLACAAALREFRGTRRRVRRAQILAPESVHFSFDKLAALLDFELIRTPVDSQFRADIAELRRKVSPRTALIVVTAGTSECGAVDDVEGAAEVAARAGVPLHVDAATGGFLIPFARDLGYPLPRFDFSIPGVSSITIDPHKYGFAPPPAGALLIREGGPLQTFEFASHYLGTHNHKTLLGTRPGAAVLAVYAALKHMGWSGYRKVVGELFARRDELIQAARERSLELAYDPDLTIVGIRESNPEAALAHLESRGLVGSVSKRHRFLRIVVQRHLAQRDYDRLLSCLSEYRREVQAA